MFPYRPLFRTILALWISSKWSLTAVGAAATLTWMIVTPRPVGEGGNICGETLGNLSNPTRKGPLFVRDGDR